MAYYQVEPWGGERGDLQAGIVASIIYNALRKKGSKGKSASDFLLKFGKRKERTPEELLQRVELFNSAFGGKDVRQN